MAFAAALLVPSRTAPRRSSVACSRSSASRLAARSRPSSSATYAIRRTPAAHESAVPSPSPYPRDPFASGLRAHSLVGRPHRRLHHPTLRHHRAALAHPLLGCFDGLLDGERLVLCSLRGGSEKAEREQARWRRNALLAAASSANLSDASLSALATACE